MTHLIQEPQASAEAPFEVLHDRILIRPEPPENASKILWTPAEDERRRHCIGEVVAVGPGMKVEGRGKVRYGTRVKPWKGPLDKDGYNRYPMPAVKPGDRVVYLIWAATGLVKDHGGWHEVPASQVRDVEFHLVRDTAIDGVFVESEAAE